MRRAALALVLLATFACQQTAQSTPTPAGPRSLSGKIGAAAYAIDVPIGWNGTLFLWSHGYVAPGGANGAQDAPSGEARTWLLDHHFAVAGSSYSSTGWALEDAFKDQVALLDFFTAHVGKPKRVIAWGGSLGGIITAGLVQLHPDRFAAAMPLCGVLAGGIATWNSELDAAYAFKTLLGPGSALELTHITDGAANLALAQQLFSTAAATPQGQARLALVAALIDLPGWFDPTRPEPAAIDYATRVQQQMLWESRVDFAFAFRYRAELEQRAGGNPSWNAGVDYASLLAASADRDEVAALYGAAGLDLGADLRALDSGQQVRANPQALAYLGANIDFNGKLGVPVLSMHTTGDGLVVATNESAYASVVASSGNQDMLRQVFVRRAGHCTFTPAETIAAAIVLLKRLDTGRWDDATLQPDALDTSALRQGAQLNSFFGLAVQPAFVAYTPPPYLRPFDARSIIPA